MGEIQTEYLLHRFSWWQIRASLRGYYRRQRVSWEVGRFQSWITALCAGNDKMTLQELMPLPWDKKEEKKEISDEEMKKLLGIIKAENEHK